MLSLLIVNDISLIFFQASALNHYESAGPMGGMPGGRPSLGGGISGGPPNSSGGSNPKEANKVKPEAGYDFIEGSGKFTEKTRLKSRNLLLTQLIHHYRICD